MERLVVGMFLLAKVSMHGCRNIQINKQSCLLIPFNEPIPFHSSFKSFTTSQVDP